MHARSPSPSPSRTPQNGRDSSPQAPWSASAALIEASRCLYCFHAPCSQACPAGVDVAEFVRSIRTGALRSAARLVLSANALGETCGCVCPTEMLCVGECVLGAIGGQQPIAIGHLQRFALHWARSQGLRLLAAAPPSGRRVALVGAGPASLACAHELARLGHQPVLFERSGRPGGLNRAAIAPHKMDTDLPLAEAEWLLGFGAQVRYGVGVGTDVAFNDLERDYDAVFIGVGLGPDRKLGIPGEDAAGVIGAIDLLHRVKTGDFAPPRDWTRVLVVGGGNSAIDAARTLKALGAFEVVLVYRRSEDQMKGYPSEWQAAKAAGVTAAFLSQPVEVLVSEGGACGLRCIRMTLGERDASGRLRPVPVPASEFELAGDAVIVAIGQAGPEEILPGLPADIEVTGGRIVVVPETGATSRAGYFAGGDCTNGGAEVVNAAAEGQRAARAIDRYLSKKGA